MNFIEAYAICTTVAIFILANKALKDPEGSFTPVVRFAGQMLFALAVVGICSLAARGLLEISMAVNS